MNLDEQKRREALESRERIIEHGQLGIKLAPEQLRKLFEIADRDGTTVQTIARKWIVERLESGS